MKKKWFLTMILMLGVSLISLNAQPDRKKEGHQRNDGPPREIKKYFKENVLPLLKIQRQELDKSLSKQEIARLDEIRSEMKNLRDEQRNKRKEIEGSNTKPTIEQRQQMRANRNTMNALMDEVEIMAENHDAEITVLLDEVRPEIEKAHLEMQRIMEQKGHPDRQMMNHPNNQHTPAMQPNPENHPPSPLHRILTPEGFLLWNPGAPDPEESDFFGENSDQQINIFPNPAEGQVQISLNLVSDTKVEISIFDKDGTIVQTIPAEKATVGIFSKTIKINEVKNGLYFIKVRAGSFETIERIIIEK